MLTRMGPHCPLRWETLSILVVPFGPRTVLLHLQAGFPFSSFAHHLNYQIAETCENFLFLAKEETKLELDTPWDKTLLLFNLSLNLLSC